MSSNLRLGTLGATLLVAAVSATSQAAVLTSGQTSVAIFENNPVGGVVVDSMSSPFAAANYTGTLTATAIMGDTTNVFGGLTFVYQLSNDAGSSNSLSRLTINGYANNATDVSYKLGTGIVAPTFIDRRNNDTIGFDFVGQPFGMGAVLAGTNSEQLVIQTNALTTRSVIANISNGAVTSLTTIGPFGIVPEPATLAVAGAASLMFRRRRA